MSTELRHWKYVKREKQADGKWRYWYDDVKTKVGTSVKTAVNTRIDNTLKTVNKAASEGLNTAVNKVSTTLNKLYDNEKNIYNVTPKSYDQKIAAVKETTEWKNIVAKSDPEYVKKSSDGTTKYLVDDYLVDKRHPVLDAVSDIVAGRTVDVNEITKDSLVAGLKDYATSAVTTGMIVAGAATTFLTEKFKLQQGTYNDDIKKLTDTVNQGAAYVNTIVDSSKQVSKEDVTKLANTVTASTNVAKVAKAFNEDDVVAAAKLIVESESVKNAYSNNEVYKMAEQTLTNLSPEEIAAINLVVAELRKK